jgi:amidase
MPLASMMELTIASFHASLRRGELTCQELVRFYLERIEAYDRRGPGLHSILTINPRALEIAGALDRQLRTAPHTIGPLHGVPVLVKDNVATSDLPTTGGSIALQGVLPVRDAFVVERLRAAGALILAKTNLHELALAGTTVSSLGGQTLNPYDLSRTPGGSSGGTGCGLAANFGLVGVGTDTGQSVRSPASAQCLVGLRPTRGLVSRHGVIPTSVTQDTVGPLARTAEDAGRLLAVLAGFDRHDPHSAIPAGPASCFEPEALRGDAFRGARIGVLQDMFGSGDEHTEVNRVTHGAVKIMQSLGATLVDVELPGYAELVADQWTPSFELEAAFDEYLHDFCPQSQLKSLRQLIADGRFDASIAQSLDEAVATKGGQDPAYARVFLQRDRLRTAVLHMMARHRLDAVLYPHQRVLVARTGAQQLERNGVLSNATGLPAITFPGGFSTPDADAPLGVPIGVELLGRDWAEDSLLAYAHAFEVAARVRLAPLSVPAL